MAFFPHIPCAALSVFEMTSMAMMQPVPSNRVLCCVHAHENHQHKKTVIIFPEEDVINVENSRQLSVVCLFV